MPLLVQRKYPLNQPPGTGDGGNVGPERYLEMVLGPPRFTPYILPANSLVKKIVVRSSINQNCSITGTKMDNTVLELIPDTAYVADQIESFAPNVIYRDALKIDSPEASIEDDIYVTIVYQYFRI